MIRNKPIHVMQVLGRMNRGGTEMRMVELLRMSDPAKVKISFCVLSGQSGPLDGEVIAAGGQVFPCRLNAQFPVAFRSLLRSQQVDVVHSHVFYSSGFILALAALSGVRRRVADFRAMDDHMPNTPRRRIQRLILRSMINYYATNILAVSEGAMASAWTPAYKSDPRCKIIYNGIDISNLRQPYTRDEIAAQFGVPVKGKLFVHVGRMHPVKNHARLIRIFAAIHQLDPDAKLLLIGRTEPQAQFEEIQALVTTLGLASHVFIAGEREDVTAILGGADGLIFPSKTEGMPGAVLEACAVGTPVVATRLTSVEEIAHHLPGMISVLSLDAPDQVWAEEALKRAEAPKERAKSYRSFQQSAFNMKSAVDDYMSVWLS